jgi:hypothetical protein
MSAASITFRFRLYGPDTERPAAAFLSAFSRRLVKPKSVELQLAALSGSEPAQASRYKLPGSVDGNAPWADAWTLPLLEGEVPVARRHYTRLKDRSRFLSLPRDRGVILDALKALRESAARLQASGRARRAWVVYGFWGPTRVAYPTVFGGVKEGWFLRERLDYCDASAPILSAACQLHDRPRSVFDFHIQSHSHVWSFVWPRLDAPGSWLPKRVRAAPRRNAVLLVQAVCGFLREFRDAEFSWSVERNGTPDLAGCAPSALRHVLGPSHTRLRVSAIRWHGGAGDLE